ncbi:hypothetical protein KJK41_04550 [Bacillus haikouensis]|nr:hypothetical protein KJK41_04550 [Bacillus haikouensis]
MISSDIYASTNPALCSLILWSFLSGYQEQNGKGCEYPLLYLPIPMMVSGNTRNKLQGTNINTGLLTWVSNNPEVLIKFAERIELAKEITEDAIIFGSANSIIDIEKESGLFRAINSGIYSTKVINTNKDKEQKEMFVFAKRFGAWCGQIHSSKIILNVLGMKL